MKVDCFLLFTVVAVLFYRRNDIDGGGDGGDECNTFSLELIQEGKNASIALKFVKLLHRMRSFDFFRQLYHPVYASFIPSAFSILL